MIKTKGVGHDVVDFLEKNKVLLNYFSKNRVHNDRRKKFTPVQVEAILVLINSRSLIGFKKGYHVLL